MNVTVVLALGEVDGQVIIKADFVLDDLVGNLGAGIFFDNGHFRVPPIAMYLMVADFAEPL